MKALVVYDSAYGNTENIAKVIASVASKMADTKLVLAKDTKKSDLKDIDLLIVGSPTQGGRPTKPIQNFIKDLSPGMLNKTTAGAFDTRLSTSEQKFPLRVLMGVIGFAAPKIARGLKSRIGNTNVSSEGFIVTGTEGPIAEGEIEKAKNWAAKMIKQPY